MLSYTTVLNNMRKDPVGLLVRNDWLILHVGKYYLNKRKECVGLNHIRQRMWVLATVVKLMGKSCLADVLNPKFFDDIVVVCKPGFSPSMRIKLGGILKKSTMMMRNYAIKQGIDSAREIAKDMIFLFESEWADTVSSKALYELNMQKWNTVKLIPLTEDVVLLRKMLLELVRFCIENFSTVDIQRIKKVLMCNVQSRNKKRGSEFAVFETVMPVL